MTTDARTERSVHMRLIVVPLSGGQNAGPVVGWYAVASVLSGAQFLTGRDLLPSIECCWVPATGTSVQVRANALIGSLAMRGLKPTGAWGFASMIKADVMSVDKPQPPPERREPPVSERLDS